jgi:hypothetical protein
MVPLVPAAAPKSVVGESVVLKLKLADDPGASGDVATYWTL